MYAKMNIQLYQNVKWLDRQNVFYLNRGPRHSNQVLGEENRERRNPVR